MHKCAKCGKLCKKQFELCYECHQNKLRIEGWLEYLHKTPEQRADELEAYYDRECVMCGKEGADYRKDGKPYCSTCWQVWNS